MALDLTRSDNVSRYRKWRSKDSIGSGISEVSTCATGRSTLTGTSQDDTDLMIANAIDIVDNSSRFNSRVVDISSRCRRAYSAKPVGDSALLTRRRKWQQQEHKRLMPPLEVDLAVLPRLKFKKRSGTKQDGTIASEHTQEVEEVACFKGLGLCAASFCMRFSH
mmetsp:Transcript_49175/g.77744  ORF Transcript_49175/g.77744 Transcript_49175/m.77744 type:complete len:164 (-) Transcript_49175:166-657(-)